jgi:hypothetical protein
MDYSRQETAMPNKHLPKAIRITAIVIIFFLLAMSAYTIYSYFFLKVQVSANVLSIRITSGTLTGMPVLQSPV